MALLNPLALAVDAIELGYSLEYELLPVLEELLNETSPANYAGSRPPQRSYEQKIEGLELFAFVAASRCFTSQVYYKFALADGVFWLVSLHIDQPKKEAS